VAMYIKMAGGPKSTGVVAADVLQTPFADYGEYFEWEDGNPSGEDRRGLFVTHSDSHPNMIRLANANDDILGVITETSGFVGNSSEFTWAKALVVDNYNQPIKIYDKSFDLRNAVNNLRIDSAKLSDSEMIAILKNDGKAWGDFNDPDRVKPTVLQTNPDFDPKQKYIPRSQRKEWACVGLLGQLVVREEKEMVCLPGKRISCSNTGKAIIGGTYKILKRNSPNTVTIFFK